MGDQVINIGVVRKLELLFWLHLRPMRNKECEHVLVTVVIAMASTVKTGRIVVERICNVD